MRNRKHDDWTAWVVVFAAVVLQVYIYIGKISKLFFTRISRSTFLNIFPVQSISFYGMYGQPWSIIFCQGKCPIPPKLLRAFPVCLLKVSKWV